MPQIWNTGPGRAVTDADPYNREAILGRRDWVIAAALFLATIISRLPFRTGMLYAWDSVLYTLALDNFDVTIHQPQPPGHIFYVGLIWIINALLDDPNAAMVWVSVVASAGAVAALYLLGRDMFNRPVGLLAAVLLATGSSFWAYGEVAYPYTLLAFLTIVIAGAAYQTWKGKQGWVLPAAVLLGAASGFRQDILPFMLPLLMLSWAGKGRLRALGAAVIIAAGVAAWYIPSAVLSGGFSGYRDSSSSQSAYLFEYFSIFGRGIGGVRFNLQELGRFLFGGLTSSVVLLAVFLATPFTSRLIPVLKDRRFYFLLIWMAPSLFFYVFVHIGDYGYVFSILPALLLLVSWCLYRLTSRGAAAPARGHVARSFIIVGTVAVVANLVLFLAGGIPFSASRITARDQLLKMRIEAIRENFDPSSTFIVSVFDYQQARYYLPQFGQVWHFDPAMEKRPAANLPEGTKNVILFEDYLKPAGGSDAGSLRLDSDQQLFFLQADGVDGVSVDWEKKEVSLD